MKICKHCNAEVDEHVMVCPECGADLMEDEETTSAPVEEAPVEETPVEETPKTETPAPEAPKKKTPWGLIAGLALAALVVVGVIVGKSHADQQKPQTPPTESVEEPAETPAEGTTEEPTVPVDLAEGHHVNGYGLPSHSIFLRHAEDGTVTYYYQNEEAQEVEVPQEEVEALLDQVVATCGDEQLTNRDLFYYNDQQFYAFYQMYNQFLGYMLDTSKGLDEQMNMEGTGTWQQFFVDAAADLYTQVAALYQEAKAQGYALTDEEQAEMDEIVSSMDSMATENGFDTVDELVKAQMGPAASEESYKRFLEINMLANSYASYLASLIEVTDADVESYYDANQEAFLQQYNLQKVDKPNVNVRHILISPEETTKEDGTTEITEEAWAAAEAKANELYESWKNGEASEEGFAQLAMDNTQDPGSQQTGGLYENVAPGQMVPEFDAWCFEDGRQPGDHGVVKTRFGYHIMYFVNQGEDIQWRTMAKQALVGEKAMEAREEVFRKYDRTTDLSNAVLLLDNMAPTDPNAVEIPMGETPAN